MFPHDNSGLLRFFPTLRLEQLISCNSDNSVQSDIMIGNTFILSNRHVQNVFLR